MANFRFVLAIALAALAAPVQAHDPGAPAASPIVGTWLLESRMASHDRAC